MIQASSTLKYLAIEPQLSREADLFDIADLLDASATAVLEPPHLDWEEPEGHEDPPKTRPRPGFWFKDPSRKGIFAGPDRLATLADRSRRPSPCMPCSPFFI